METLLPSDSEPTLLTAGSGKPATPPPVEPEPQAPAKPSSEAATIAGHPLELLTEPPSEPAVPTVEFTPTALAEPTLVAEPVVTPPQFEPLPPPPSPPPPSVSMAPLEPKKSNNRTWLIVAIVVLLLCCCCCILGLGVFVLQNRDQVLRDLSQLPWRMLPLA